MANLGSLERSRTAMRHDDKKIEIGAVLGRPVGSRTEEDHLLGAELSGEFADKAANGFALRHVFKIR